MRIFRAICALLVLPIFLYAQKAPEKPAPTQKVVTGTVLINDHTALNAKQIMAALKSDWKMSSDSASTKDKTIVFSVPGATVMIAWLDYPVPPAELQAAASMSWLWKTAAAETARHQSQVVISVIGTTNKTLELYKIFTKTAGCVLENSNASAVYMSGQYLLLSKGFYTAAARNLLNGQSLPIYCWVYFGMLQDGAKNSGYTFGLSEFGLLELEVVSSEHPMTEVHSVLYDAASDLVLRNVQLKEGMMYDGIKGIQLPVKVSKAAFLEGNTVKLGF